MAKKIDNSDEDEGPDWSELCEHKFVLLEEGGVKNGEYIPTIWQCSKCQEKTTVNLTDRWA